MKDFFPIDFSKYLHHYTNLEGNQPVQYRELCKTCHLDPSTIHQYYDKNFPKILTTWCLLSISLSRNSVKIKLVLIKHYCDQLDIMKILQNQSIIVY